MNKYDQAWQRLAAAARMVWKGRRSLGGESFVLNVVIDEASPQAADANLAIVRRLAALRRLLDQGLERRDIPGCGHDIVAVRQGVGGESEHDHAV